MINPLLRKMKSFQLESFWGFVDIFKNERERMIIIIFEKKVVIIFLKSYSGVLIKLSS